jgi:hypothetical protein
LESIKGVIELEPLLWNVEHKSISDVFDEIQPNLIFIHESQLDMAFELICQEFEFQYVLVGNDPVPSHISKMPAVILTTNENAQFKQPSMQIQPLARVAQIHNANVDNTLASNVVINSTNINITPNIQQLLLYLVSKYNAVVFGNQPLQLHQYIGAVNMFERATLIQSAKAVVDFSEYDFWDASYLKVPCICMNPRHPFIIPFNNIQSLDNNLNGILHNNIVRTKYIKDCHEQVYDNNTSYHFCSQVFKTIGKSAPAAILDEIATTLIQSIESLKHDRHT